ncbi:hypothetical protein [Hyphomicrobium denitrificans]|uniref:hypothetical protein n=1 Tax=Hyphomicrobium denitrificans TaxID=53399 RepID=UPI00145D5D33|nr:hypothetical protein [Hyphomicrobium denitrificans]
MQSAEGPGSLSRSDEGPAAAETTQNEPENRPLAESQVTSPDMVSADNVRLLMVPRDQINEFLAFEIAHAVGASLKRSATDWVSAYRHWASVHAVGAMPESIFLNLLGNAPGIRKTRERRKDPRSGRVLKNSAGTPLRDYFYALGDIDDGASKKPKGKRETKAERSAREAAQMAERRRLAEAMPQLTWAEYLASMSVEDREKFDLQHRPLKAA